MHNEILNLDIKFGYGLLDPNALKLVAVYYLDFFGSERHLTLVVAQHHTILNKNYFVNVTCSLVIALISLFRF